MVNTSTKSTLPQQNSTFFSDLETFLAEEDALRFQDILNPFVVENGLHGTGGSLIGDPGSTTAYPGGFFVNETGTITYNDNTTHHWVIIHKDIVTVVGGDWIRVSGTHYLFDPVSAVQPTAPEGSLILMDVVTAGGAITTVTDLRNLSAFAVVNDVFKAKISSDDTTADFLVSKLAAGAGITLTETNPGADETLTIDADSLVTVSTNDTTPGFLEDKITSGDGIKETVQNAFGDEDLLLDLDLTTTSGLEITGGQVQVNTVANGGVALNSNGVILDINGTDETTVIDEATDEAIIEDDSQTGEKKRKILITNLIPVVTQVQAEAGTLNTGRMTPLRAQQLITSQGLKPEIFTFDGTYNVPENVTTVYVEATGGGGGGGGGSLNSDGGGGGGSGGFIRAIATVTGGGSETVTIGQGGAGGATNGDGVDGGNTTFGSLVTANGGDSGFGFGGSAGGAGGTVSTTGSAIIAEKGQSGGAGTLGGGFQGGTGGGHALERGDVAATGGNGASGDSLSAGGSGGDGSSTNLGGAGNSGYLIVTSIV